jgi:hypothetical protein
MKWLCLEISLHSGCDLFLQRKFSIVSHWKHCYSEYSLYYLQADIYLS